MRPYAGAGPRPARRGLTYRLNFVLGLFAMLFQLFAMLAIWRVLLASGTVVGGFDWPQMKAYLLVGFVSGVLVSQFGRLADGQPDLRRHGRARPHQAGGLPDGARFAEVVGAAWTEVARRGRRSAPASCCSPVRSPRPRPRPRPCCSRSSLLAVLPLKFLIVYLTSLACFWTQNYLGVHWARQAVVSLFSGALVPLSFFPGWLQRRRRCCRSPASPPPRPDLPRPGRRRGRRARLIAIQVVWVLVLWVRRPADLAAARSRQVTIHGG